LEPQLQRKPGHANPDNLQSVTSGLSLCILLELLMQSEYSFG